MSEQQPSRPLDTTAEGGEVEGMTLVQAGSQTAGEVL